MVVKFNPTGFLDVATDPSDLPSEVSGKDEVSGAMVRCTNLHLDRMGIASTRRGSTKLSPGFPFVTGYADNRDLPYWDADLYADAEETTYLDSSVTVEEGDEIRFLAYTDGAGTVYSTNTVWHTITNVTTLSGIVRQIHYDNSIYANEGLVLWARPFEIRKPGSLDELTASLMIESGGDRYIFTASKLYRNEDEISSGYTEATWFALKYHTFNSADWNIFATNGIDRVRIVGDNVYFWGIDNPPEKPVLSVGRQTGLTGDYNLVYTYARKEGTTVVGESNPSDDADAAVTLSNQSLQAICGGPLLDTQVTHMRFYRTTSGGSIYYYDQDIVLSRYAIYTCTYEWEVTDLYLTATLIDQAFQITSQPEESSDVILSRCDQLDNGSVAWEKQRGADLRLDVDSVVFQEGSASIKVRYPHSVDGVARCRNKTGVWDLTNMTYLYVWLYNHRPNSISRVHLYFGQNAWDEQHYGPFELEPGWQLITWNISSISGGSREAVKYFAVRHNNVSTSNNHNIGIDQVWATSAAASNYKRLFSWEPSSATTDETSASLHHWEPVILDTNTADTALGTEVATDHDPPPLGQYFFGPYFNGICFILKDNLMYYSKEKQPEYWPSTYYLEICSPQFILKAGCIYNGQIYVANTEEIYLVQGTGHETWSPPFAMSAITGTVSSWCFLAIHGIGIVHLGFDGIYVHSGSADQNITNDRFRPVFKGTTVGSIPGINQDRFANCWMLYWNNKLWFAYPETGSTYPDNFLVTDLKTLRTVHYDYGSAQFPTGGIDYENDRMIAVDTNGNVWTIDDPSVTTDDGTAISWQIESKVYSDQLRKYFPRAARYDVTVGSGATANGYVLLDGSVKQTHAITESRQTKRRLVTGCTGSRLALRISGTGTIDIYAGEVE